MRETIVPENQEGQNETAPIEQEQEETKESSLIEIERSIKNIKKELIRKIKAIDLCIYGKENKQDDKDLREKSPEEELNEDFENLKKAIRIKNHTEKALPLIRQRVDNLKNELESTGKKIDRDTGQKIEELHKKLSELETKNENIMDYKKVLEKEYLNGKKQILQDKISGFDPNTITTIEAGEKAMSELSIEKDNIFLGEVGKLDSFPEHEKEFSEEYNKLFDSIAKRIVELRKAQSAQESKTDPEKDKRKSELRKAIADEIASIDPFLNDGKTFLNDGRKFKETFEKGKEAKKFLEDKREEANILDESLDDLEEKIENIGEKIRILFSEREEGLIQELDKNASEIATSEDFNNKEALEAEIEDAKKTLDSVEKLRDLELFGINVEETAIYEKCKKFIESLDKQIENIKTKEKEVREKESSDRIKDLIEFLEKSNKEIEKLDKLKDEKIEEIEQHKASRTANMSKTQKAEYENKLKELNAQLKDIEGRYLLKEGTNSVQFGEKLTYSIVKDAAKEGKPITDKETLDRLTKIAFSMIGKGIDTQIKGAEMLFDGLSTKAEKKGVNKIDSAYSNSLYGKDKKTETAANIEHDSLWQKEKNRTVAEWKSIQQETFNPSVSTATLWVLENLNKKESWPLGQGDKNILRALTRVTGKENDYNKITRINPRFTRSSEQSGNETKGKLEIEWTDENHTENKTTFTVTFPQSKSGGFLKGFVSSEKFDIKIEVTEEQEKKEEKKNKQPDKNEKGNEEEEKPSENEGEYFFDLETGKRRIYEAKAGDQENKNQKPEEINNQENPAQEDLEEKEPEKKLWETLDELNFRRPTPQNNGDDEKAIRKILCFIKKTPESELGIKEISEIEKWGINGQDKIRVKSKIKYTDNREPSEVELILNFSDRTITDYTVRKIDKKPSQKTQPIKEDEIKEFSQKELLEKNKSVRDLSTTKHSKK